MPENEEKTARQSRRSQAHQSLHRQKTRRLVEVCSTLLCPCTSRGRSIPCARCHRRIKPLAQPRILPRTHDTSLTDSDLVQRRAAYLEIETTFDCDAAASLLYFSTETIAAARSSSLQTSYRRNMLIDLCPDTRIATCWLTPERIRFRTADRRKS